jgi:hypothetical protein
MFYSLLDLLETTLVHVVFVNANLGLGSLGLAIFF